jgi:hypothetical protein
MMSCDPISFSRSEPCSTSATISVERSGSTSIPFGNSSRSATCRAEPSGVTMAMTPGANGSPAIRLKPPPLTYALPRASTTSSFTAGGSEAAFRSPWVTSDPSCSRRRSKPSRADTTSKRPSGSQSTHNGNDDPSSTTSLLPSRSTAITSWVPQSENHNRPSCQRGCSPNTSPPSNVRSSDIARPPLAVGGLIATS